MIEAWFPTLIYSSNLVNIIDNNELYKKAIEIKSNLASVRDFNVYNTYGVTDITTDPHVRHLIGECKKHVNTFANQIGARFSNIILKECWFNVYEKNDFQEVHSHSTSHLSLVYYVKVPPDTGDLVILSHSFFSDMFPIRYSNDATISADSLSITPAESDIIIFKSNVLHRVKPNKSSDHRVSVAMNFILQ